MANNVERLGDHRIRPVPVDLTNADDLIDRTVQRPSWVVRDMAPRKNVSYFTGDGGLGKTLLMLQAQVCLALGRRDLLGMALPGQPASSLGFYCEDDKDELHSRLEHLCRHYGATLRDLGGHVHLMCRANEIDNALMKFSSRDFDGKVTPLYHTISEIIREHNIELTVLDNVGNVFLGQHNEKAHVIPFVGALRRLAQINSGSVILCGHPSLSGKATGTGMSGSQAWETAVRCRVYLKLPAIEKDEDGDPKKTSERVLQVMKSNYGPVGGKIRVTWKDHVFVTSESLQTQLYYADRD